MKINEIIKFTIILNPITLKSFLLFGNIYCAPKNIMFMSFIVISENLILVYPLSHHVPSEFSIYPAMPPIPDKYPSKD